MLCVDLFDTNLFVALLSYMLAFNCDICNVSSVRRMAPYLFFSLRTEGNKYFTVEHFPTELKCWELSCSTDVLTDSVSGITPDRNLLLTYSSLSFP